jgi:hypothetical protein
LSLLLAGIYAFPSPVARANGIKTSSANQFLAFDNGIPFNFEEYNQEQLEDTHSGSNTHITFAAWDSYVPRGNVSPWSMGTYTSMNDGGYYFPLNEYDVCFIDATSSYECGDTGHSFSLTKPSSDYLRVEGAVYTFDDFNDSYDFYNQWQLSSF